MELRPGRRPGLSGSIKYRGVCGPSGRRPGYTRPGRRKPAKRRGILWSRWLLAPRWGAKTAHAITAATGAVGGPKGRLAELCSAYGRLCLPDGAVAAAIACAAADLSGRPRIF